MLLFGQLTYDPKGESMLYNWEGDYIIQNTEIKKKRYVIGSPNRQITTDLREWISSPDNKVMKDILRELVKEGQLPRSKKPGDFDKRAMILWKFVAQNIRYVHDSKKQNKDDFWLFPSEIYTLRQGDCEDGTFLLASLLIASGISPFCVRVVLGEIFDEKNRSLGGHCWPVYKNELGVWCILESTLDRIPTRMPEASMLTQERQYFRYVPYYCFNNYHLWEIAPEKKFVSGKQPLPRYQGPRKHRVNMSNTILPSGGWLSRMTGDWEPGHLEVTTEALKNKGFSEQAITIAADGSQDPDFYNWSIPASHAQTGNDAEGRTTESPSQAIDNYVALIKSRTRQLCDVAKQDKRGGLFLLGYILHSIQDLATHKGITNAQHAYISKLSGKANDPDHDEANRNKSGEYSRKYLEYLNQKYASVYDSLLKYDGSGLPWGGLLPNEKGKILGVSGWDLTPAAYLEYNGLTEKYKKIKDDYPLDDTIWNSEEVFALLVR
jgi:hypothetical protein